MFYLCVCAYGHSRSVALCRTLHGRGVHAVAAGVRTAGDALELIGQRAEKVLVLDDALLPVIPKSLASKVVSFHVGPDRWVNPYHPELRAILEKMVDEKLPGVGNGKREL